MIKKKIDLLNILFFENLLKYKEIRHFVSTRTGGFSNPPYNSLTWVSMLEIIRKMSLKIERDFPLQLEYH